MTVLQGNTKLILAILSIIQLTSSAKTNARPVYEVLNEQPKAEERSIKTSAVANLPYGNPLAGNSQQNAKLHAHNQQAMFNAERVRQQKAQLLQQQRRLKTPQIIHNYMKYHESQENHQLELERQSEINDDKKETESKDQKDIKEETVKQERKRKPRSHGSEYQIIAIPSNQLKPNLINQMTHISNNEYIPQYINNNYQALHDIEILNSLLNKNPNEQLNEFNALINTPKINLNHNKEEPIDLYFHLKEPTKFPPDYYHTNYAQIPIIQENNPIKESEIRYIEPVKKNIQYIYSPQPLYKEEYQFIQEIDEKPKYQALRVPVYNAYKTNFSNIKHNGQRDHLKKDDSVVAYEKHYAPSYEFGYRVRDTYSGNDFGHQEEQTGEETNGQYHVLLPDGRMQNVKYSAGPDGFHADISYYGRY